MDLFKRFVKQQLKKRNLKIWPVKPESLSGFDLEEDLIKMIRTETPTCFDIGANHGQTVDFLLQLFKKPDIYAFEPGTSAFNKLKKRKFPQNIQTYHKALGAENTSKEFINYNQPWLNSFLELEDKRDHYFKGTHVIGTENIEVITLDLFATENQINRIDYIKLDTQGYDFEVLKGAQQCLRRGMINVLQIELNFVNLYKEQGDPIDIIRYLHDHDMKLVGFYDNIRRFYYISWCNALFIKA